MRRFIVIIAWILAIAIFGIVNNSAAFVPRPDPCELVPTAWASAGPCLLGGPSPTSVRASAA